MSDQRRRRLSFDGLGADKIHNRKIIGFITPDRAERLGEDFQVRSGADEFDPSSIRLALNDPRIGKVQEVVETPPGCGKLGGELERPRGIGKFLLALGDQIPQSVGSRIGFAGVDSQTRTGEAYDAFEQRHRRRGSGR